jgi:hypothetical protein
VEHDFHAIAHATEAELLAFWGYDVVAPGGLLDRIYREMQVGQHAWLDELLQLVKTSPNVQACQAGMSPSCRSCLP